MTGTIETAEQIAIALENPENQAHKRWTGRKGAVPLVSPSKSFLTVFTLLLT